MQPSPMAETPRPLFPSVASAWSSPDSSLAPNSDMRLTTDITAVVVKELT